MNYLQLDHDIKTALYIDTASDNLNDGGSKGCQVLFIVDTHGKWYLLS